MCRVYAEAVMLGSIALLGLTISCQQQQAAVSTRARHEAVIRVISLAYTDAASNRSLDRVVSFYAGDASLLPPGAPIAHGKEQIRGFWSQLMTNRGFLLHRHTTQIEVAKSSGLGYESGTYELTLEDGTGAPMTNRGKFLAVWKDEGNGKWKIVVDTFNLDLPQALAKPPASNKKKS